MSNISEQIRERFINSIPDIDEKDLKISIENTIKNCSVSNSFDRSSFFGASFPQAAAQSVITAAMPIPMILLTNPFFKPAPIICKI